MYGFWKNLPNNDIATHKSAISYQKILRTYVKAKLGFEFLKKCKSTDVYPKLIRLKNVKNKTNKEKKKLYKANLNDAIKTGHNDFTKLQQQHVDSQNQLRQSTTWLKYHSIFIFINRLQSTKSHLIKLRHHKKHDNLIIEKRSCDCTQRNPNKVITNLTNTTLTQDEISVLDIGLKHGVLLKPKEPEMIAIAENVWKQREKHNILKDNHISKVRAQTALQSFSYNCLDLDIKQYISINKMIKVLQNIKEKCLILKPDKGQEIVLIDKTDYYNSMERLCYDTSKFTLLQEDPTLRNLSTVQTYLDTLHKRNEITLEDKNLMQPKFAQIGRAHGLPKTHEDYQDIPPFRPIVDSTSTPHYGIGKCLSSLLNPLTINNYYVEDSFEAAKRIKAIPPELFNEGYKFISFDVTSLFTNVPLKRTANIILKRIYVDKVIPAALRKRTMKKHSLDACTKTIFSFNSKFYKQIDGVSMGLPLGPVLANIIMTELESTIVKELVDKSLVKLYMRYVDNTLLLVNDTDINYIHKRLNSFDKNIKFTVDTLPDGNVHF